MSQFTLPIDAQGVVLLVVVTPSGDDLWALDLERKASPRAVSVLALADTGANQTCLDPSVLEALDLEAAGMVDVTTPLTEGGKRSRYNVGLVIPARALGDVLERCLLFYNGPEKQFTLAY